MLKLKKIAITGTLSSGKSVVCDFLEKHGAYLVSSDKIVHQLLSTDTDCIKQVINLLGSVALTNQELDRKKIANTVFSDAALLRKLEQILHPRVLEEIKKEYEIAKKTPKTKLFVAEVPLLFEAQWEPFFDHTVYIQSSKEKCIHRSNKTPQEYEKRMQFQLVPEKKQERAEFTIKNEGTLAELKRQVNQLIPDLMS